ncbi:MAG: hypothetical protein ACREDR_19190 [Blastocatellia bacterium]
MLPIKEFAKLVGVPYTTVMYWVKGGRIKGAVFEEAPTGGYWLIPEAAANNLERPKLGRPRKQAAPEKKPAKKSRTRKSEDKIT